MKVLILANFDVGLYQFRRELIEALLKENKVTISLPNGELVQPLVDMGCSFVDTPVDRRGVNPVRDFSLLLRYFKLLHRERPDMVITYTIKPNVYGGFACRMLCIPCAANITGLGTAFQKDGVLKTLVTVMYKVSLKKSKVVFFENAENKQTLLNAKIVRKEQCCLLNGAGVNLEHYAYVPYPAGAEPVRFLFIGRVMREKGVDELFAAMEHLRADGIDCTLDVLGDYEENYEPQIRQSEAKGWLCYHGYRKDVRPFIAKAHCFVLPSWHEGMANTNLECAAMGRPIITSRIHGCMEAVIENESGLLCEPQDAESLYQAMKRISRLSNLQREQMGRAGRKHMEAVFDKKLVVDATIGRLEWNTKK